MSSAHLCYRELLPPTGVRCAAMLQGNTSSTTCCDLLTAADDRKAPHLAVCTAGSLKVYDLQEKSLWCSFATRLFGIPRDIAVFGPPEAQRLVVTLDEGKVVVFAYEPVLRDLRIVQTVNVEENAFGLSSELVGDRGGKLRRGGVEHKPFLAVDEHGSLAAVTVYGHQLLLVPLPGKSVVQTPRKPFMLRKLPDLGVRGRIMDLVFLKGYGRPALAVLHELSPLPVGHLAKVSSNMCVSVLAVDVCKRTACLLWRRPQLPHDSFQIKALEHSNLAGTVLVVSLSAVLMVGQERCLAFALNGFAALTVHKSIRLKPAPPTLKTGVELDASRWCPIADGSSFLVGTKTGAILHVRFLPPAEGTWQDTHIVVEPVARGPVASCLCALGELVFLGSRDSDSLLLELFLQPVTFDAEALTRPNISTPSLSGKKPRRTSAGKAEEDSEFSELCAHEESLLYGAPLPPPEVSLMSYAITLGTLDTLAALGPILHGQMSQASGSDELADRTDELDWGGRRRTHKESSASAYIVPREAKNALYFTGGYGTGSSVYRISGGYRLDKLALRNFPGALYLATLSIPQASEAFLFVSFPKRTRVMRCSDSLSSGVAIQELQGSTSPFVFVDATLCAGILFGGICAQVYTSGIRIVRLGSGEPLQDVIVEEELDIGGLGGLEGEHICSADILGFTVVVLTNKRVVYLLEYSQESEILELKCKGGYNETDALSSCFRAPISNVSLYYGSFSPANDDFGETVASSQRDTGATEEEIFFYGKPLDDQSEYAEEPPTKRMRPDAQNTEKMYLLICDVHGRLTIIDIEAYCVILSSFQFSNATKRVSVSSWLDDGEVPNSPRVVSRARLLNVSAGDVNISSVLLLVCVLDTYDVVVYRAIEEDGYIAAFIKSEHSCVTRKRSKARTLYAENTDLKTLNSFLIHDYHIHPVHSPDGCVAVVVSGPNPVRVSVHQGMPCVVPLSFPEVSFANTGTYSVLPITCGTISGVAMLWQERDEVDGEVRMSKEAEVGIYQHVSGQTIPCPLSDVSMTSMRVGLTTHAVVEVLPKTDDPTELALLKQKTHLLVCSEQTLEPFAPLVLSEQQFEDERSNYDRFYPDMESFFQPDREVGPPPPVIDRQFKLVLVQGGAAIDVFPLKEGEHILNATALYLIIDHVPENSTVSRKMNRVFLSASTSISDKHGEDTQGEGRLLLFTIDFALYQGEDNKGDASTHGKDLNEEPAEDAKGQSAAQTKFLSSIRPKLNLAWEGPGPATVVKQMGDYVVSSVGPVLYVYRLISATMELQQIGFFYAQFFITSVSVVKNFICVADASNSVQIVVWRESDYSLTLIASDYEEFGSMVSGFLIDDNKLGIVAADDEGNIKIMTYNPRY